MLRQINKQQDGIISLLQLIHLQLLFTLESKTQTNLLTRDSKQMLITNIWKLICSYKRVIYKGQMIPYDKLQCAKMFNYYYWHKKEIKLQCRTLKNVRAFHITKVSACVCRGGKESAFWRDFSSKDTMWRGLEYSRHIGPPEKTRV